jgi:hypothetical protein
VFALLVRAGLLAERLGLVEGVVLAAIGYGLTRQLRLNLRQMVLVVMMAGTGWIATEVSRNVQRQLSFQVVEEPAVRRLILRYTSERLVGYYADATNKYLVAREYYTPSYWPESLFASEFRIAKKMGYLKNYIPKIKQLVTFALANGFRFSEFNNPGGLSGWYLDWGNVGTIVGLLILGGLAGGLYRGSLGGEVYSLMWIGGILIGIAETPRVYYFGEERFVVPMGIACIAVVVVGRMGRPAPSVASAAGSGG